MKFNNLMNKKIKAIVFDFGGVIELNDRNIMDEIAKVIGIPHDDLRKEYFKHNHLSNVENKPWEEVMNEVLNAFKVNEETKKKISQIVKEIEENKKINHDLVPMFEILKKQGFVVAIFSNNTSDLREKLAQKGILEMIDEVVISAEIGFQKPHKEAFQVLFEKLNVRPEEVIFIDDTPKSLEKSGEIGYIPILFKNNEQLTKDLEKFGISL